MEMNGKALISDVVAGSAAGYGATMAMEYFSSFAHQHRERGRSPPGG